MSLKRCCCVFVMKRAALRETEARPTPAGPIKSRTARISLGAAAGTL